MAAMAGEIVHDLETTDRFLTDVRRTIADCVADWRYGRWAELAHANGMKVRAEAGGQHHPRLLCNDGLMNQGRMDVPVAEFWESEHWKENQWVPAYHHTITTPGGTRRRRTSTPSRPPAPAHLYGKTSWRPNRSRAWAARGLGVAPAICGPTRTSPSARASMP